MLFYLPLQRYKKTFALASVFYACFFVGLLCFFACAIHPQHRTTRLVILSLTVFLLAVCLSLAGPLSTQPNNNLLHRITLPSPDSLREKKKDIPTLKHSLKVQFTILFYREKFYVQHTKKEMQKFASLLCQKSTIDYSAEAASGDACV